MNFRTLAGAVAVLATLATAGSAATYNIGDVTNGEQVQKTLTKQTLDFLDFTLDAPDGFRVSSLDITVTSIRGSNLSEVIAVYAGGKLVAKTAGRSGPGGSGATLSFSGAQALADGTYTLGVGGWKSFFTEDINDASSSAFFNNGSYTVKFDTTVSAVPLPAGGLLLLTGLGALTVARRKRRAA